MTGFMAEWWDKIVAGFAQAAPPAVTAQEIIMILFAAAALSIPPVTWRFFGLFCTLVHELGHAFAGVMTGRVVTGITLRFDHSGTTSSTGRRGFLAAWSGFWGYPVPAVVGATLIWASLTGWAPFALSVCAIIMVLTVLVIRNGQGLLIIAGCIAASLALVWFAPAALLGHVTLIIGIALLVGAVRDWFNVIDVHVRRRDQLATSDAYILFRSTMIPSPVWLGLFGIVIGFSWVFAYGSVTQALLASG